MANMERLSPTVFDIPIAKIRRGYYSAVYFSREKRILEKRNHAKMVLMQVFQKKNAILCGTDEAIAVLKLASGEYRDPERAYKLFDRYVEKQREVRKLRIVEKNYNKTELVMREMLNLEIELDRIWEDKSAELGISSLYDGDRITPWETVMTIGGLPQHFAHLESVYLGILARRTHRHPQRRSPRRGPRLSTSIREAPRHHLTIPGSLETPACSQRVPPVP